LRKTTADGLSFVFNTQPWKPADSACARPLTFFLSRVRNETAPAVTVTEYTRHHVVGKQPEKERSKHVSSRHRGGIAAMLRDREGWAGHGSGGADTAVRRRQRRARRLHAVDPSILSQHRAHGSDNLANGAEENGERFSPWPQVTGSLLQTGM